jgi:hypothetical protein
LKISELFSLEWLHMVAPKDIKMPANCYIKRFEIIFDQPLGAFFGAENGPD